MGNILYRSLRLYKLYVSNGDHKSINHGKSILFFVVLFSLYRSNPSSKWSEWGEGGKGKSEFFPTNLVVTLILEVNGT